MSTAGKVLAVLVTLASIVLVILGSAVTQLNKNGGEAILKLNTQLQKMDADLLAARKSLTDLKIQLTLEQVAKGQDLTVIRSRLADVEEFRAGVFEANARVASQLAVAGESVKAATEHLERKKQDKADLEKAKAENQAAVEKLIGEEKALREDRDRLLGELKDLIAGNRQLQEKIDAKAAAPAQPASTTATPPRSASRSAALLGL
jgi:chromosome segregation ATPase